MTNNELYLKSLIKVEIKKMLKEGIVVSPTVVGGSSRIKLREEDVAAVDPTAEAEVEKAFEDAINKSMSDLKVAGQEAQKTVQDEKAVEKILQKNPELQKLAQESIRRRKQAITEGNIQEQRLNEIGILFAVSLAVAIPRIVELVGKAVKFLTIAMGGKGLVGDKLQKAGHKWHHIIIKLLMKGLRAIPGFKELPPDKQEKIAKIVHMVIVGGLAVASGVGAVDAAMQGKNVLAGVEGALAAVKAGEVGIAKFLTSAISKILS